MRPMCYGSLPALRLTCLRAPGALRRPPHALRATYQRCSFSTRPPGDAKEPEEPSQTKPMSEILHERVRQVRHLRERYMEKPSTFGTYAERQEYYSQIRQEVASYLGTSIIGPGENECLTEHKEAQDKRLKMRRGDYPEKIAIVGGGISGLAAAHFISKEHPKSKITIFEAGDRLGGWIKSVKVPVETEQGTGHVLFEYGARTLRPAPEQIPSTAQLIQDLGLEDEVLRTLKTAPAAQNRFIFYPDRLTKLPAAKMSLWGIISTLLENTQLFAGVWKAALEFTRPKRPDYLRDESVADFIRRRVDGRVGDNLVSAVIHGIYAGDINQLSAKSIFPKFWALETRFGSITDGLRALNHKFLGNYEFDKLVNLTMRRWITEDSDVDPQLLMWLSPKDVSTFTFRGGMQQLVQRLEERLRANGNIEIRTNTRVREVNALEAKNRNGTTQFEIGAPKIELELESAESPGQKPASPETEIFDFAVVTQLKSPDLESNKHLAPPVTVQTVNLWYKTPHLVPVRGFGYLIPRSVPFEMNPERALGVLFDHDATPAFDASAVEQSQDSVPGTKLTVMLGGHWWDGWTDFPTDEEAKEMAMSVLKRHLGINAEPDVCHVNLAKDCIPQYTVGFTDRLRRVHEETLRQYQGRLRLLGASYTGVGVGDCIRAAHQMALSMRQEGLLEPDWTGWQDQRTGLEGIVWDINEGAHCPWRNGPGGRELAAECDEFDAETLLMKREIELLTEYLKHTRDEQASDALHKLVRKIDSRAGSSGEQTRQSRKEMRRGAEEMAKKARRERTGGPRGRNMS